MNRYGNTAFSRLLLLSKDCENAPKNDILNDMFCLRTQYDLKKMGLSKTHDRVLEGIFNNNDGILCNSLYIFLFKLGNSQRIYQKN